MKVRLRYRMDHLSHKAVFDRYGGEEVRLGEGFKPLLGEYHLVELVDKGSYYLASKTVE